jgi:hypothetical protein
MIQRDGKPTDITGLVMLEIADRKFAIEAVVVLFGELIVPGRATRRFCVVAEESGGWRLSLCTPECVQLYLCDDFRISNSVTAG